jgi:hypothetical protein
MVTRPERATSLIIRDLIQFWQRKSFDRLKRNFRFNPFQTNHIRGYYVGPDPFRNALPVTAKIRACARLFPQRGGLSHPMLPSLGCILPSAANLPTHITSLRLRRNAGTSRSSCSKFPGMLVSTLLRMLSSETTSAATRSFAFANGTGATSSI